MRITLLSLFTVAALQVVNLAHAAGPNPAPNPQSLPDLTVLAQSGYIMGPGSATTKAHKSWQELSRYMPEVTSFNSIVQRIQTVVCGTDTNRSVLVTGESGAAYKYLFAILAANPNGLCKDMWHVEVNVSKVEAGHKFVGEVDEYWQNNILRPSEGKDVVLYLSNLDALVGVGSHSNDETGIEREYVSNLTGGRIRSVAFIDKYGYTNMINSRNSYVVEAFADKIVLPPLDAHQVDEIVHAYMRNIAPGFKLTNEVAAQLYRFSNYYQPNRGEPDRTMNILGRMIRNSSSPSKVRRLKFRLQLRSKARIRIPMPQASSLSSISRSLSKLALRSICSKPRQDTIASK